LGHTLTGAIVQLEVARKMVRVDEDKAVEAIDKTQKITRDGFAEVKRAIKALRPIMIEDSTLEEALEALIDKTQNHCQVVINANIEKGIIQDENTKITIYRIIQEAITNSIRHGEATEIDIKIDKTDKDALMITVSDNGKGCKTISEGYGLKGIKERVQLLEGKMATHSEYGKGFELALTLNQRT
jgi:signal transduction histidine kinase